MKAATVVCRPSVRLLSDLEELAAELGLDVRFADDHSVQLAHPDGRLFTMFAGAEPDWEWQSATRPDTGETVDLRCLTAFVAECRWEQLFCTIVEALDTHVGPLWVVDTNGVLWPANQLDPTRIVL